MAKLIDRVSRSKRRHMSKLHEPVVVATIGGIAAVAVVLILALAAIPSSRDAMLFEMSKAAIGIVPVAFFGVLIAELVRKRDDQRAREEKERDALRAREEKERDALRELERNRDEYRRRFLNDVVVAYNRIKGVRRNLRAAGLGPTGSGPLTAEKLDQLDAQLAALNDSQLELERLKREVESRSDVFPGAIDIHAGLMMLEDYANAVIKDWESGRGALGVDAETLRTWPAFQAFVASAQDIGNFAFAAKLMTSIEEAIWPDLIGYRREAR